MCLAGAVIAETLHVPMDVSIAPESFPTRISDKLRALNEFRVGSTSAGMYFLFGTRGPYMKHPEPRLVTGYYESSKAMKKELLALATEFEEVGL